MRQAARRTMCEMGEKKNKRGGEGGMVSVS